MPKKKEILKQTQIKQECNLKIMLCKSKIKLNIYNHEKICVKKDSKSDSSSDYSSSSSSSSGDTDNQQGRKNTETCNEKHHHHNDWCNLSQQFVEINNNKPTIFDLKDVNMNIANNATINRFGIKMLNSTDLYKF